MWKVYLRQIVRLLRENKFFSVVYILGTALSVAMIMLILITYHIKSGDIGVEDRRSRTAYVIRGYAVPEGETHWSTSSFLSPEVVEKWFYPVKSAEAVSILVKGNTGILRHTSLHQPHHNLQFFLQFCLSLFQFCTVAQHGDDHLHIGR